MGKINLKNTLTILYFLFLIIFFFPEYFYVTHQIETIKEYLGIYEVILIILLGFYVFSLHMKNLKKKLLLRTRIVFSLIFFMNLGYLYLINKATNFMYSVNYDSYDFEIYMVKAGSLDINLGYIELYSFLSILKKLGITLFTILVLICLGFSLFIVVGKIISWGIIKILNLKNTKSC